MGQWVHAGYCGDGWVVHWYGGDGCKPGSGITIDGVVVGCEVVIGGVSSSGVGVHRCDGNGMVGNGYGYDGAGW